MKKDRIKIIKYIYLYLVTAISIILIMIASIGLIRLILEEYVFDVKSYEELESYYECGETSVIRPVMPLEEELKTPQLSPEELEKCKIVAEQKRQERHVNDVKRDLINWASMLLVAVPLYLYHWGLIRREAKS